jgi:uncharacterized protein DUF4390
MSRRRMFVLVAVVGLAVAAADVVLRSAETLRIVPIVDGPQVFVSFELSDAYTDEVREAISSGLKTTFTYDVELRMPVAGWVDRTIATAVVTTSGQYDNLTRRHTLSRAIDGHVVDTIVTDNESKVREWLTKLARVPLCQASRLDASRDYFVRIRARRRPSGSSLLGWASNITGQIKFTFLP